MIEVQGVSKRYGEFQALDNVSFVCKKGQIVGFLGANGAGKTTTMDIICGCQGPDQGTVRVAGYDITDQPVEAKRRLGYLPDTPPLHRDMRVREYVEYAAKLRGLNSIQTKARANEIYEQLALGDQRERLIGNLSKGYRQRVALAQAIVHDPDVLVLDEPTEGLDPTQIVHIRELIRSLAGKHTIILSSHILSEVQNVCDHIVIISKGKIVQEGSYDELVAELGAGKLFRMQVEHNGSALLEGARRVRGIANVQMIDDGLEFAVSEQQAIDELLKLAVSGGHGVRYLAPKKKSLEDVFFQLTGSAQQEAQ